ncbi:MAG: lipopolysaccharide biosynthesis protein [Deltaproteobacteria bacterium]|nr:lipopolysaccharide biosynthesis protein [Deltaproteobacteria bacterium]
MNDNMDLQAIKGIIRRQKSLFITVFTVIFLLAVVIALVLPSLYRSQVVILIEEQQIPQEYVKTAVTSYVEERLQLITQQIMSRPRLLQIIKQFNLYRDLQDRYTTEEIIERMRKRINLETISADVIDKRTGRPSTATIAFTLSFEDESPSTAQKVVSQLASLYMEENLRTREEAASNITSFLQQELDNLKKQINELEEKISVFKQQHKFELPEFNSINLQAINRLQRDLDQLETNIRTLQERKIYLEGQLATIDPSAPIGGGRGGEAVMPPRERLKYLRVQLLSLQSTLSPKHPDIKKLKKEIAKLEAEVGDTGGDDLQAKAKELDKLQKQLTTLRSRLGPKHPDVVKLAKKVKTMEKEVDAEARAATQKSRGRDLLAENPDNPAYINIRTQIASTTMELEEMKKNRQKLQEEIRKYQQRLENGPVVEREYSQLTRDYENAKYKYNEILNKLMEARVAKGMEESQKGERFTIIDPAQLPEKPFKPNRLAIVLIGFVLALGAGVGAAAVRESLNDTVKTAEELQQLTGLPVLAAVDQIVSEAEVRKKKRRFWLLLFLTLGILVAALVLFHNYVMPLDILWLKLQRKFGKLTP